MATKKPANVELACQKCGEEVSGPDEKSVAETMARHTKKRHGGKK